MNIHIAESDIAGHVREIADQFKALEGPLLPILHAVQHAFGFIPQEAVPVIAAELNLSRADVHGVVSFYHDYRDHPAGRHVLRLCRAEACQSMGGDQLAARVKAMLGIDWHGTTPDGAITLEPVFCLGLCSCSPTAMMDGEVHGRVDIADLEEMISEARR
ncbi:formate dehydrogenase subunit gamma [Rhizobium sp. 18055]|uniref:formate dehydrogenase subunit gamma n=1 Tax=Rhizobium sp. 18055 TaxID=2681403 RepID=UPI00135BA24D|nr:formate dehydrogenase subunit gamma [Rhizobium sp. 18055]